MQMHLVTKYAKCKYSHRLWGGRVRIDTVPSQRREINSTDCLKHVWDDFVLISQGEILT